MLRMVVEGVGFDHQKHRVVVLKDWEGRRLLPIWIDAGQARSIAWELEGVRSPRPGSHDLLLQCIRLTDGRVTRIVINDLQESTFYATIDIETSDGMKHIDARPSDAIAVAVRAKCPVFVDGGALDALIDLEEVTEADIASLDPASALDAENFLEELTEGLSKLSPDSARTEDEIQRFKRLLEEE